MKSIKISRVEFDNISSQMRIDSIFLIFSSKLRFVSTSCDTSISFTIFDASYDHLITLVALKNSLFSSKPSLQKILPGIYGVHPKFDRLLLKAQRLSADNIFFVPTTRSTGFLYITEFIDLLEYIISCDNSHFTV
jgi:hypothetical protein